MIRTLKRLLDHAPAPLRHAARDGFHAARGVRLLPEAVRRTRAYLAASETGQALPRTLYVELTNICNAACVFCLYPHETRARETMAPERFKAIVDRYAEAGGRRLGLTPMTGELLVHPQALELAAHARGRGIGTIYATSNGILLDRHPPEAVLNCGITSLSISVSTPDEAVYEAMYRNKQYRRVMGNIQRLLEAFHATPERILKTVSIEIRADRPEDAVRRLPDFQAHVASFERDGVSVHCMTHYDDWTGLIRPEHLLPGMSLLVPSGRKRRPPCHRAFFVMVLADGRIRLCGCRSDLSAAEDHLELGHVDGMDVVAAFNGPRARAIIRSFYDGHCLDICRKCSWYAVG